MRHLTNILLPLVVDLKPSSGISSMYILSNLGGVRKILLVTATIRDRVQSAQEPDYNYFCPLQAVDTRCTRVTYHVI